jgi:hypothetical protein
MKTTTIIFFTLTFLSTHLFAQHQADADTTVPSRSQHQADADTIVPSKGNIEQQLKDIRKRRILRYSDSTVTGNVPKKSRLVDSTKRNRYNDLLDDDPEYNKKSSIFVPAYEIVLENAVLNVLDQTVLHEEFSKVNFSTWKRTLSAGFPWTNGWIWDQDRFGNNFLSHPMTGSFYFNAARSNGYNYWESVPFVFAGSYMWKIFGENGPPEREDLINTTFDGIALGEILYRISSNILDDRSVGSERVFREIFAGIVDPIRGINRLFQGKSFRRTNKEVYQTEPLNITFYGGVHSINNQSLKLFSGENVQMLNLQLDYGNPFEVRPRKPFDVFRFRTEFNFGEGRKIVDNVTGYGILFGGNTHLGNIDMLYGLFHYYDYFDTQAFELSTTGFGGGLLTKVPLGKQTNLYTNFHLAVVPFAGSSVGPVSDTSQYRDYRFAYGMQGKIESDLTIGKLGTFSIWYYWYLIHAFNNTGKDESTVNTLGTNVIQMIKPRLTIHLFRDLSFGLEQDLYFNTHSQRSFEAQHFTHSEQRVFLMFYWEDPQRKGHYN